MEKECDDSLIIEVTQNIDDYLKVGHDLTLSRKTLQSVSQDNDNNMHRKNAVLWAWKIKNGNNATYIELLKAFMKMRDRSVVESILKMTSRKTTSKQTVTTIHLSSEMAKDQYPNWEDLTDTQKEAERYKLMDEIRDVHKTYVTCINQLIGSFSERKVESMRIRTLANFYCGGQLFPEVVDSKEDSITTVLNTLTGNHCTWFNYDLIQVIVDNIAMTKNSTWKYIRRNI